jgi:hypothetical protein
MPTNLFSSLANAFNRVFSRPERKSRPDYVFNVGLDFGTAFIKCIVRDVGNKAAWPLQVTLEGQKTFLIPSRVQIHNGRVSGPLDPSGSGVSISYLKMALAATCGSATDDIWWQTVSADLKSALGDVRNEQINALTVFLLTHVLSAVRRFVVEMRPDFGVQKGDCCFVNMAVPVAHAESLAVQAVFHTALQQAYHFAFDGGLPSGSMDDLLRSIDKAKVQPDTAERCALYPEVSANVQSYIRSAAARQELHLFVDVGAGTVDLSAFIYFPHPSNDRPLSYLAADVLPLGASQIELRAALGGVATVDQFRRFKETGNAPFDIQHSVKERVRQVASEIEAELAWGALRTLRKARALIPTAHQPGSQFYRLQLLMGGGGSAEPLYTRGIRAALQEVRITDPPILPLPIPGDLIWPHGMAQREREAAFKRLSVAYGLSFMRADLDEHRFPRDIEPLPPRKDPAPRYSAPTKDEC